LFSPRIAASDDSNAKARTSRARSRNLIGSIVIVAVYPLSAVAMIDDDGEDDDDDNDDEG